MKGIAIGIRSKRGFPVQKRDLRPRPRTLKGVCISFYGNPAPANNTQRLSKRKALARGVIREVSGYAPYERRIMDLLQNSFDKRALRLAKRKLGTHQRGKRKREELSKILTAMKLADAAKKKEDKKDDAE